jgi:hypothetical protein
MGPADSSWTHHALAANASLRCLCIRSCRWTSVDDLPALLSRPYLADLRDRHAAALLSETGSVAKRRPCEEIKVLPSRQSAGLKEVTPPFKPSCIAADMDSERASRIELFEAMAAKGEKALARQRRLMEELRADGHRTADAEEVLQRYEAAQRRLLEKLAALRQDAAEGPGCRPGSQGEPMAQSGP